VNLSKGHHISHFKEDLWFYKSLLDGILRLGGGCQLRSVLQKLGYQTLMIPDMKTLLTPLHYCYKVKELQMQSAHILIKDLMKS
jgi:hypothetical protein